MNYMYIMNTVEPPNAKSRWLLMGGGRLQELKP